MVRGGDGPAQALADLAAPGHARTGRTPRFLQRRAGVDAVAPRAENLRPVRGKQRRTERTREHGRAEHDGGHGRRYGNAFRRYTSRVIVQKRPSAAIPSEAGRATSRRYSAGWMRAAHTSSAASVSTES